MPTLTPERPGDRRRGRHDGHAHSDLASSHALSPVSLVHNGMKIIYWV